MEDTAYRGWQARALATSSEAHAASSGAAESWSRVARTLGVWEEGGVAPSGCPRGSWTMPSGGVLPGGRARTLGVWEESEEAPPGVSVQSGSSAM